MGNSEGSVVDNPSPRLTYPGRHPGQYKRSRRSSNAAEAKQAAMRLARLERGKKPRVVAVWENRTASAVWGAVVDIDVTVRGKTVVKRYFISHPPGEVYRIDWARALTAGGYSHMGALRSAHGKWDHRTVTERERRAGW